MTFTRQSTLVLRAAAIGLGLAATVALSVPASAGDDAAAMRVYRDPVTGEFTGPPSDAGRSDALSAAAAARTGAPESAPSELVEEPGASAAGGVTMDLRGRFRSDETATVDANGSVQTHCHPAESQ